jgi:DNA-binding MarR family transcriptional regulator
MAGVSDELRDIEQALDVIVRWSQYRFYSRVMKTSSVTLDRSTVSILNRLIVVGPQLLPELASYLGLDRSTISRQATAAVHLGVVEKTAADDGSRAYQLSLTEYGRDCILEVRSRWLDLVRGLLDELSPQDQRGLATYLPRLSKVLEPTFETAC